MFYRILWIEFVQVSFFRALSNPTNSERVHSLDPPVSGTSENSKTTDLQVRLFCSKINVLYQIYLYSIMNRLHKPLRDLKFHKLKEGHSLGPLVSGTSENHRPSSKTLCNKLDVMYQIYSYILLWVDCIKTSKRSLQSPKPPKGPFLDPVSGTSENHRPSSKTLCNKLDVMYQIYSYILLWVDYIKTSKRSLQSPNPQRAHFWTLSLGPWDPKRRLCEIHIFFASLLQWMLCTSDCKWSRITVHRLYKPLKISRAQTSPRTSFLDPGLWDLRKHENTMFVFLQCWWMSNEVIEWLFIDCIKLVHCIRS